MKCRTANGPLRARALPTAAIIALSMIAAAASWPASAADSHGEIGQLIQLVAESGCTFIRNGRHYGAGKAADHLRLKYRRGRKYADTPEHFIERLASKSSLSGKLYFMQCDEHAPVETRLWLRNALLALRAN